MDILFGAINNSIRFISNHIFLRINPERQIGSVGSLKDHNVTISRFKEKLFIIGSFDMMMNGWSKIPTNTEKGKKVYINL